MTIHSLRIQHFRNLTEVNLIPRPQGINLFWGENGSGKTNLLEAIYYLGLARSFRQTTSRALIQHTAASFSLFAEIHPALDHPFMNIGMHKKQQGTLQLKVGEEMLASISELATFLPIQVIHSQSHHFFELGPTFRRKYLDWGLFYHSPLFLSCWHQYMRVLRQRNSALRQGKSRQEILVWTESLCEYAMHFDALRRAYVNELLPLIMLMTKNVLPFLSLEIIYYPGWDEKEDLMATLIKAYLEESRLKYTQWGPHRADLLLQANGQPIRHLLSRGQQKLLICAMMMAQGMLLTKQGKKPPIYLIDDLPAELDRRSSMQLIKQIIKQPWQVFITAIERADIETAMHSVFNDISLSVFHVEHGNITHGETSV